MKEWFIRILLALAVTAAVVAAIFIARQLSLITDTSSFVTAAALFTAVLVFLRQISLSADIKRLRQQTLDIALYESEKNKRMESMFERAGLVTPPAVEPSGMADAGDIHGLRANIKVLKERLAEIENPATEPLPTYTRRPDTDPDGPDYGGRLAEQAFQVAAQEPYVLSPEEPEDILEPAPVVNTAPVEESSKPFRAPPPRLVKTDVPRRSPVDAAPDRRFEKPTAPAVQVPPPVQASPAVQKPRQARQASPLQRALEKNRLDLHLQPIISLPDRKPTSFEAFMRLQTGEKEYLDHEKFYQMAKEGGLIPTIETKVVFSAVRMLRSLRGMKKQADVFCTISKDTLTDVRAFNKILSILENNQTLNTVLVLQITQRQLSRLGTKERVRLSRFVDLGYALCLNQVADLKLDIRKLNRAGFQFVKTDALIMLHANIDDANFGLNPMSLVSALKQANISLIVNDIEKENQVISLLDMDVGMAQGALFAPPRPVKAELLEVQPHSAAPRVRAAG